MKRISEGNREKRNKTPWPTRDAMAQIYEKNLWGGKEGDFYSGHGSHDPFVIEPYLAAVKSFLGSFDRRLTICDMGCGDFNIGRQLLHPDHHYIGVDIVPALIERNKERFKHPDLEFNCLDIAEDEWPGGDIVILRQVLQHLSNSEIQKIIPNLRNYECVILTEHLPDEEYVPNVDILSGQGIRLKKGSGLDLLSAPFGINIKQEELLLVQPDDRFGGKVVTKVYWV